MVAILDIKKVLRFLTSFIDDWIDTKPFDVYVCVLVLFIVCEIVLFTILILGLASIAGYI